MTVVHASYMVIKMIMVLLLNVLILFAQVSVLHSLQLY